MLRELCWQDQQLQMLWSSDEIGSQIPFDTDTTFKKIPGHDGNRLSSLFPFHQQNPHGVKQTKAFWKPLIPHGGSTNYLEETVNKV